MLFKGKGTKNGPKSRFSRFLTLDCATCIRVGTICVWELRKDGLECLFPKYGGQIPHIKKSPRVFGLIVFWPEIWPIF